MGRCDDVVAVLACEKRPINSWTPRIPNMVSSEIMTSTTFATPGSARSSELTTVFIPALREIMRRGRSTRIARSVWMDPSEMH